MLENIIFLEILDFRNSVGKFNIYNEQSIIWEYMNGKSKMNEKGSSLKGLRSKRTKIEKDQD
jgi:hypothetical protein